MGPAVPGNCFAQPRPHGLAEYTIYTHLVLLKQAFKWAVRENLLAENPVSSPKLRKPVFGKQPCFTPDQVKPIRRKYG